MYVALGFFADSSELNISLPFSVPVHEYHHERESSIGNPVYLFDVDIRVQRGTYYIPCLRQRLVYRVVAGLALPYICTEISDVVVRIAPLFRPQLRRYIIKRRTVVRTYCLRVHLLSLYIREPLR